MALAKPLGRLLHFEYATSVAIFSKDGMVQNEMIDLYKFWAVTRPRPYETPPVGAYPCGRPGSENCKDDFSPFEPCPKDNPQIRSTTICEIYSRK